MFPFEVAPDDRKWLLSFALIAGLQAIICFILSWNLSGGHFMLPLDDSYIHLQYAKQLAEGKALVYTDGMTPSGGMTSPLYVALLAPLFLAGLDGVKGAFCIFLFGAACWMLTPVWTYQLVKRLSNCLNGAIAGALVLANGHLIWNFLSGMETGLFTLMVLGIILGFQCWWQGEHLYGKYIGLAGLALLPLLRPEGVIVTAAVAFIVLLRRGEQPRLSLPLVLCTVLPFLGWLLLLKQQTGDWRPAGLIVKGLSGNPILSIYEKMTFAGDTLFGIFGRFYLNRVPDPLYGQFKGTTVMPYLPVGAALFALTGAALYLVKEIRWGRPSGGSLVTCVWLLGLVSLAASLLPFIHQQRYLAPFTVLAIVLIIEAAWYVSRIFTQKEEMTIKVIGLALILSSLPSLLFWGKEYGENSRDIFHLLRKATFTTAQAQTSMAITDAGVLAYYSDRPMWDLVGLGSSEFSQSVPHGEGAILERLSKIEEAKRPLTLLSYPNWWSSNFPLGTELFSVSIPRTTITSGIRLVERPILWDQIDNGKLPPLEQGASIIQEIDVADLKSESMGEYTFETGPYDRYVRAWPQPLTPVMKVKRVSLSTMDIETTPSMKQVEFIPAVDGGRVVRGESFWFRPSEFPSGQILLKAIVGSADPGYFPQPGITGFRLSVQSNTTGFTVIRDYSFDHPDQDKQVLNITEFDLSDLFDEAGGEAWKINIQTVPQGLAYTSCGYWIMKKDEAHKVN